MSGSGSALLHPRSGNFLAPGRPLPAARLADVRDVLFAALRDVAAECGLGLEDGAGPEDVRLRRSGATLFQSCDLAEVVLKRLLGSLPADLIGGANVTRLDRPLALGHPRLPYRRALRIVGGRGWHLQLGEDLPAAAQASLIRFCGLLPVQILYLPGQPRPSRLDPESQGFCYCVPWGGRFLQAALPLPGRPGDTVLHLRRDRLLQFVLGLDDTIS